MYLAQLELNSAIGTQLYWREIIVDAFTYSGSEKYYVCLAKMIE